jgi:hypothetical protein
LVSLGIEPRLIRRLEAFDRQTWGGAAMTCAHFACHADFLGYKVALLPHLALLRSSSKNERMIQTRHIQFQGFVSGLKRAVGHKLDFRCRKASIVNRLGNQNGIEGFSQPWEDRGFSLHQIHISMTNAIQAFQGLFGPFGSKPSYHAVDFDRGFFDLR